MSAMNESGRERDEAIISPPKYEQLKNFIYKGIKNNTYPLYSKLDSEDEFANRFNVSRGTVRQAIQGLEKEGIVERVGQLKDGKEMPLQKGDKVLYSGYSSEDFEIDGEKYLIVEFKDIIAKMENGVGEKI